MGAGPERSRGLASIVLICRGRVAPVRRCIAALARPTSRPWELVAVAEAATGDLISYLQGVQDLAGFSVTIVEGDRGTAPRAARDLGSAAARGDYLVFLDDDVIVTEGWLEMLIALADSEPSIGMAAPMSNRGAPAQVVADPPDANFEAIRRFASAWHRERKGSWSRALELSGSCLLIKRRAFEAIGGWGTRAGSGHSDEGYLARRAIDAGFGLAVAADLYVHRSGGLEADDLPGARADRAGLAKVFGVGLPRTGTTSVAAAMLELGYRTAHSCFDDRLFDLGDAFFDTPVYVDFERLDRRYPGSKFILTWRDPDLWFESFERALGGYLGRLRAGVGLTPDNMVDRRCYAETFGDGPISKGPFIDRYLGHRYRVERHFLGRTDDLLVLDLGAQGDSWARLAEFLGLSRPTATFPRLNAGSLDQWLGMAHPMKLRRDAGAADADRE